MSGRGGRGGRSGVITHKRTSNSTRSKIDQLTSQATTTRAGSRSPARAGRRESPARNSPTVQRGGGRGGGGGGRGGGQRGGNTPRGGQRGGKQKRQLTKQSSVGPSSPGQAEEQPSDKNDHINVRKTKMPKINENPDAPEMSDMEDIRVTTKVDLLQTSGGSEDEAVNGTTTTTAEESESEDKSEDKTEEVSNGHDCSDAGDEVASKSSVDSLTSDLDTAKSTVTEKSPTNLSSQAVDGLGPESPSESSDQHSIVEDVTSVGDDQDNSKEVVDDSDKCVVNKEKSDSDNDEDRSDDSGGGGDDKTVKTDEVTQNTTIIHSSALTSLNTKEEGKMMFCIIYFQREGHSNRL